MPEPISCLSDLSESLGRIIIENVRDFAIFATDLNGRILSWNPGVGHLLGYTEDEFVGQSFYLIFTAEDIQREAHQKEIETAIATGRAENQRWHLRKDGNTFFASGLTMQLKDGEGNIIALAKILRDDTARKRLEDEQEELLKREHESRRLAENAYRTNSEFLKLLVHELKNPLQVILGWTRMLRKHQLDSVQTEKALEIIEQNGVLQSRLIEDVFDISRISSGKLQLQKNEMNLSGVVRQVAKSILPAAAEKNITVESSIESPEILINGDPDRIQQLISNLLTNALKFTQEGGRIMVSLKQSDSVAQIIITDNGRGISPKDLPSIFEPYTQANSKLETKESGLGLGLALVKHLVEMHGGSVTAESDGKDKGTAFTVTLPI